MPPPFSLERFFSLMSLDLVGEEEKVPVFSVIRKCQDTSHVFTNVTKVHLSQMYFLVSIYILSYRNKLTFQYVLRFVNFLQCARFRENPLKILPLSK